MWATSIGALLPLIPSRLGIDPRSSAPRGSRPSSTRPPADLLRHRPGPRALTGRVRGKRVRSACDPPRLLRRPRHASRSAAARSRSSGSTRCQAEFDVGRLPYSLKILLENLLRGEDGAGRDRRAHPGARRLGPDGRATTEIAFTPEPGADAGLHRRPGDRRPGRDARRDRAARRRPDADQPAGAGRAGHRPLDPGRRVRRALWRSSATPSSSSSATASATRSCAGARRRSTTSRSCRRTRASATRSTSSTSRASCTSATARRSPTRSSGPIRTPR